MPLSLTVVTAERTVLQRDDVLRLIVPAADGQITILPSHTALMSSLGFGELTVVCPGETIGLALLGGFLQVAHDRVTVLADAAERADEINEERADAARERAQRRLAGQHAGAEALNVLRARLAAERALVRLRVRRRYHGTGVPSLRERA
ncbi:MAG: ATP synthase F1 subunit epsilon [Dehalococcoidia bacterium]|nr:ATP synthase F1 subunit epsilon [Dehalococcoidia bacterium]